MTTAHQVNPVVISIEVIVLDLVLENRVNMMTTAHQENLVVVLMEHAPQNVNSVPLIDNVDQTKPVAVMMKVILANVLDLVLENRVTFIPTAH
jgi:accessory gene regulator protein AgrB